MVMIMACLPQSETTRLQKGSQGCIKAESVYIETVKR